MATTRIATGEWHGSLIEGKRHGEPRVERARHVRRDLGIARRGAGRPHEPRGADRGRARSVLLDVAVERAHEGRHAADDAATPAPRSTSSRARASRRSGCSVSGDVPGLDDEGFREAAEDAKENCPVSKALVAVPITLTIG